MDKIDKITQIVKKYCYPARADELEHDAEILERFGYYDMAAQSRDYARYLRAKTDET